MKVIVEFDDELLRIAARDGRPVSFTVFLEHGNTCYPDRGWVDCGAVIIGWWLVALRNFTRESRPVRLMFMEGPYGLTVDRLENSEEVVVYDADDELRWEMDLRQLVDAITRAADEVLEKFRELNLDERAGQGLAVGVAELHKTLNL